MEGNLKWLTQMCKGLKHLSNTKKRAATRLLTMLWSEPQSLDGFTTFYGRDPRAFENMNVPSEPSHVLFSGKFLYIYS